MTTITKYKPELPRLTFEQWKRHIQMELFKVQQRNMQYRILESVSGNFRNIQPIKP